MGMWENMGSGRRNAVHSEPDTSLYFWSDQNHREPSVTGSEGRWWKRVNHGPETVQGLVHYSKDWLLL